MANIDIDTTDPTYQQFHNGLASLRTYLTPRVKLLRKLPRANQKAWLQRDPLMRRAFRFSLDLSEVADEEMAE